MHRLLSVGRPLVPFPLCAPRLLFGLYGATRRAFSPCRPCERVGMMKTQRGNLGSRCADTHIRTQSQTSNFFSLHFPFFPIKHVM